MFVPNLAKLPLSQQKLWTELAPVSAKFVLYGGTAISLRIAHRESVDFDLFSSNPIDPDQLMKSVPFLRGATPVQVAPNTLVAEIDRGGPVKISFFGNLAIQHVMEPERSKDNGLMVASLLDLAATKLKVLWQRSTVKDYFDLDALIQQGIPLPDALAAAQAIYGPTFNPMISLKALVYFEEGDVSRLSDESKKRLQKAVRDVDVARLPTLQGKPGLWSGEVLS